MPEIRLDKTTLVPISVVVGAVLIIISAVVYVVSIKSNSDNNSQRITSLEYKMEKQEGEFKEVISGLTQSLGITQQAMARLEAKFDLILGEVTKK